MIIIVFLLEFIKAAISTVIIPRDWQFYAKHVVLEKTKNFDKERMFNDQWLIKYFVVQQNERLFALFAEITLLV